jgi:hypothetical protein
MFESYWWVVLLYMPLPMPGSNPSSRLPCWCLRVEPSSVGDVLTASLHPAGTLCSRWLAPCSVSAALTGASVHHAVFPR